jgi:LPS export ABC transporter protein LptC
MKRFSSFRLSLATLIFAGVTLIIIALPSHTPPKSENQNQSRIVDESMTHVKAKRFSQGVLSQTLTLNTWVHHKGETSVYLNMPTLTTYQPDGGRWQISALEGQGYQQHRHGQLEKLELSKEVLISSFNQEKKQQWRLMTDFLSYDPLTKKAITQHEVFINGPEIKLQAKGMSADLNQHSIELLQKVSANYALSSF